MMASESRDPWLRRRGFDAVGSTNTVDESKRWCSIMFVRRRRPRFTVNNYNINSIGYLH